MVPAIGPDDIDHLTGDRLGTFDVPCPLCGPSKRAIRNQRRPILRIYRIEPGFAGFHCARCGVKGAALDRSSPPPDPIKLAKARAAAAERDRALEAKRLGIAQWLWSVRMPITGTIAEFYLRSVRGYGGPLPATLGFLPASRGRYPPTMICAFGLADETGPGEIAITDTAVRGMHLTRLLPDGSGKATFEDPDEQAKIMIGRSAGWPLILAPPTDGLGLCIVEGIENALSADDATGLCAWAAGCASRLPSLARAVPPWAECVTIIGDADDDGRRHAVALADRLYQRGMETRVCVPNDRTRKVAP
jgi:hypothetical protein